MSEVVKKNLYSDNNESLRVEKINFDLLQILFSSTL